jgi:hypothetical protein
MSLNATAGAWRCGNHTRLKSRGASQWEAAAGVGSCNVGHNCPVPVEHASRQPQPRRGHHVDIAHACVFAAQSLTTAGFFSLLV